MRKTTTYPNVAHVSDGDLHAVATALRVLITPADAGGFVAQGLEIDYVATGDTVEEVQDRFARGLLATIESLIRRARPLSALFKSSTPPEAWQAFMDKGAGDMVTCVTAVDLRDQMPRDAAASFPFGVLAYCRRAERAAA
ncbi:MAG: type II toxin-antitoxin system HicB family antitoxin [Arenimonas sp.]